jgi:hypothetical protein
MVPFANTSASAGSAVFSRLNWEIVPQISSQMDPKQLMATPRLTFLSHFVMCLACLGLAFFAWANDAPQTIWANDMSMMTSVVGVLFLGTAGWLGWQAWKVDDQALGADDRGNDLVRDDRAPSSDFGHLAERLAVMAGFVGTAIGLSLQAKSLAGGATSFVALATSLFTTATGGTAAALIAIMTFNLESGIRRVRRRTTSR